MKDLQRLVLCAGVCSLLVVSSFASGATGTVAKIERLVQNGTVILNDESGTPLLSLNAEKLFTPASIIKVLTSQIALDLLGADYRFKTECYLDNSGNLTLKGYGDPFMVSDEIRLLAKKISAEIGTEFASLTLDNSFYVRDVSIPGLSKTSNPYDALNGALVVNFNTMYLKKEAGGIVVSAEKETPLTALARERGETLAPGSKERFNLSSHEEDCRRYAGELCMTIFREQGIAFADTTVQTGAAKGDPACTYTNSRDLAEVLQGLLKYSNNFIANQLFLTIGAEKHGAPASMKKGRAVFEEYIRKTLGIPESELVMVEGSGISRENKVTGNVMISIMEKFQPHADLFTPKKGHPVKSGTLHEVSNYAGYINTSKGQRAFVIMLNQPKNYRDSIMKLLADMP